MHQRVPELHQQIVIVEQPAAVQPPNAEQDELNQ